MSQVELELGSRTPWMVLMGFVSWGGGILWSGWMIKLLDGIDAGIIYTVYLG